MRLTLTTVAVLASVLTVRADTRFFGGGSADIANGTALPTDLAALAGTWNLTTSNWAADRTGAVYTAWSNTGEHNTAWLGFNLTTALNGAGYTLMLDTDPTLNSFRAIWSVPGSLYGYHLDLDSTAPRTLTFNGEDPLIHVQTGHDSRHFEVEDSIAAVGSGGLYASGNGGWYIYGDWSGLTGDLSTTMGLFQIDAIGTGQSGKMSGISRFLVNSGTLSIQGFNGANDVLNDSAQVHLRSPGVNSIALAKLEYQAYGSATAIENISKIVLDTNGILDLADRSGGATPMGQLVLTDATAGIDRGPDGKGTLFLETQTDASVRTAVTVQNGIAADTRLPWVLTLRATGAKLNASKQIETIPAVAAPTDPALWAAGSEYVISSPVVGTVNSISVNLLGILRNANETLTIGSGQTLTIAQGTLGRANASGANLYKIVGGKITSGIGDLYLFAAQNANQTLHLESEITGDINVVTCGGSPNIWAGSVANTYTGTTYANGGSLQLNRNAGVICVPGDLVVGRGGIVTVGGTNGSTDNKIATGANVTVRDGGTLTFDNFADQLLTGVVTIEGGTMSWSYAEPIVLSHAGAPGLVFNGGWVPQTRHDSAPPLRLLTGVSYASSASRAAAFTSIRTLFGYTDQFVDLNNTSTAVTQTWAIADSGTLPAGVTEMACAIPIYGSGSGLAALRKAGAGILYLSGLADDWGDGVEVDGGTLIANSAMAQETLLTGRLREGSTQIRDLSGTAGLHVGMRVLGPGLVNRPAASYERESTQIISIDGPTRVTLNNPVLDVGFGGDYVAPLRFAGVSDTPLTMNGTLVNGSRVITGLSSTAGLYIGQAVDDNGGANNVQDGTHITSVDSATQITVSHTATASTTKSLAFGTFKSVTAFRRHVVQTGVTANGSAVVTGLASTTGLSVGQRVLGPFAGNASRIVSIDGPSQVKTADASYNTGTTTLTFCGASAVGHGPVHVNADATLIATGAGTVTVAADGTLDAGDGLDRVGTLVAATITVETGATLQVDLAASGNDLLQTYGDLTIAGHVSPSGLDGYVLPPGGTRTLATVLDGGTIDIGGVTADAGYAVTTAGTNVYLTRLAGGMLIIVR